MPTPLRALQSCATQTQLPCSISPPSTPPPPCLPPLAANSNAMANTFSPNHPSRSSLLFFFSCSSSPNPTPSPLFTQDTEPDHLLLPPHGLHQTQATGRTPLAAPPSSFSPELLLVTAQHSTQHLLAQAEPPQVVHHTQPPPDLPYLLGHASPTAPPRLNSITSHQVPQSKPLHSRIPISSPAKHPKSSLPPFAFLPQLKPIATSRAACANSSLRVPPPPLPLAPAPLPPEPRTPHSSIPSSHLLGEPAPTLVA